MSVTQPKTDNFHPDFLRIQKLFVKKFGETMGLEKFFQFVSSNRLDVEKPYRPEIQFKESFQWIAPLIQSYKQDKNAKYYKITALNAAVSMNNQDWSDTKDMDRATVSMNYRPVNLNHNHATWFNYPATRVDYSQMDEFSVELTLRVDNKEKRLQQMLDHDLAIPEKEWINHPSIEARGLPGGGYSFTGLALLQKGYALPGDPTTEIVPLFNESVKNSLVDSMKLTCSISGETILCKAPTIENLMEALREKDETIKQLRHQSSRIVKATRSMKRIFLKEGKVRINKQGQIVPWSEEETKD